VHECLAVSSSGKLVVCGLINSMSPRSQSRQERRNKAEDNEEYCTPVVEK